MPRGKRAAGRPAQTPANKRARRENSATGEGSAPPPIDWGEYVSPSNLFATCADDPILDWFRHTGGGGVGARDPDGPNDLSPFLMAQGIAFEEKVMAYLKRILRSRDLHVVAGASARGSDARSQRHFDKTRELMQKGVAVIAQGVLRDDERRLYGIPDLLVRSDFLPRLVDGCGLGDGDDAAAPPWNDCGDGRHDGWGYVPVDIKFKTLQLCADGVHLLNSGTQRYNKAQVVFYCELLKAVQGWRPPVGFLLGRGWRSTKRGVLRSSLHCLSRLGRVSVRRDAGAVEDVARGIEWVRWIRAHAREVSPTTPARVLRELGWPGAEEEDSGVVPCLLPNMKNQLDRPWHTAKRDIAEAVGDITLIWNCGVRHRAAALAAGVKSWRDPNCTALAMGIRGPKTRPLVDTVLRANRAPAEGAGAAAGGIFFPREAAAPAWTAADRAWADASLRADLFVDFETLPGFADDFAGIPTSRTAQTIVLIGAAWRPVGGGAGGANPWEFRFFGARAVTPAEEGRIILEFLGFAEGHRCFHWATAEQTMLKDAFDRHDIPFAHAPRFVDMHAIARDRGICPRGAKGFGLKPYSAALLELGHIQTSYADTPLDGTRTAVALARLASERADLAASDTFRDIVLYNRIDCLVLGEVVEFLWRLADQSHEHPPARHGGAPPPERGATIVAPPPVPPSEPGDNGDDGPAPMSDAEEPARPARPRDSSTSSDSSSNWSVAPVVLSPRAKAARAARAAAAAAAAAEAAADATTDDEIPAHQPRRRSRRRRVMHVRESTIEPDSEPEPAAAAAAAVTSSDGDTEGSLADFIEHDSEGEPIVDAEGRVRLPLRVDQSEWRRDRAVGWLEAVARVGRLQKSYHLAPTFADVLELEAPETVRADLARRLAALNTLPIHTLEFLTASSDLRMRFERAKNCPLAPRDTPDGLRARIAALAMGVALKRSLLARLDSCWHENDAEETRSMDRVRHDVVSYEQLVAGGSPELMDDALEEDNMRVRILESEAPLLARQAMLQRLNETEGNGETSEDARSWIRRALRIPFGKFGRPALAEQTPAAMRAFVAGVRARLDELYEGAAPVKDAVVDLVSTYANQPTAPGTVFIFCGPPGTGKSQLASTIATALGRYCYRFEVGGLDDASQVRGSGSVWVSSRPGRPVQAMIEAGAMNPVMVVDEVDKAGPALAGALVHYCDPVHSQHFSDDYFAALGAVDVSHHIKILVCNSLDGLLPALADRATVFHFKAYDPAQKRRIARRVLIPRSLAEVGRERVQISDGALDRIVAAAKADEDGVRDLERVVRRVAQRANVLIACGYVREDAAVVADAPTAWGAKRAAKRVGVSELIARIEPPALPCAHMYS